WPMSGGGWPVSPWRPLLINQNRTLARVFWPLLLGFFKSSSSWKKTSQQFYRYIVGGSIYFWVGYGLFALGYSALHWWWLWAKLLGDVVGWSLNYVVQRYWAFSEHHKFREI